MSRKPRGALAMRIVVIDSAYFRLSILQYSNTVEMPVITGPFVHPLPDAGDLTKPYVRPPVMVWRISLFIAVLLGMGLFCVISGILGLEGLWQFTYPGSLTGSSIGLIITGINYGHIEFLRDLIFCPGAVILIVSGSGFICLLLRLRRDKLGATSTFVP